MKLYLDYKECSSGGEIRAGQEEESWPDYEDINIDWHLTNCKITSDNGYCQETVDVDFPVSVGQTVFVVYVRYSTGDTFSRTYGAGFIVGVYKDKETAEKVQKSVYDKTYTGYACWIGYFESLESCEVKEMTCEA
jgi:hypothetical protein